MKPEDRTISHKKHHSLMNLSLILQEAIHGFFMFLLIFGEETVAAPFLPNLFKEDCIENNLVKKTRPPPDNSWIGLLETHLKKFELRSGLQSIPLGHSRFPHRSLGDNRNWHDHEIYDAYCVVSRKIFSLCLLLTPVKLWQSHWLTCKYCKNLWAFIVLNSLYIVIGM